MGNRSKNILVGIVVLLILTNISMMVFIWNTSTRTRKPWQNKNRPLRTEHFIEERLDLNPEQMKEFSALRSEHREEMDILRGEIRLLNRDFHEAIVMGNTSEESRIAGQIDSLTYMMKKETVAHIKALANICTPMQKKKFLEELNKLPDRRGNRGDRRKRLQHRRH
jgi:hypothetical protein